jgi:hypothetical protein
LVDDLYFDQIRGNNQTHPIETPHQPTPEAPMRKLSTTLLLLAILPALLLAQAPRKIAYQGMLTDDAGAPKPAGKYFFTFSLYDVSSGGAALWSQAESLMVERGMFTTLLGQTAFGPTVAFDKPYWIGIKVGTGTELSPRLPLAATAYSMTAIVADSARVAGSTPGAGEWSKDPSNNIYYNLGNVGVGTATPAYKLDILHAGSTGIHVKSSAGFSVFDLDAQSGDAAIRFQKEGVSQWNLRNRPGDNYLEVFEMGGGGSRMVIQDSTGNVGIGETSSPKYKLDILHSGASGVHVKSATGSGLYSTVDVDADNGDAALRFQKAGAGRWSIRNRPTDDYLEFIDLLASRSRLVLQNGTGNLGVGDSLNPSYKLDVLHAGATGIRSRSSSTFSVVDIDAANGDAALRFAKAGVNQWNIRNNPGTDDLQIFELGGGGERMRIENTTGNVVLSSNLTVTGTLAKGAGSFKIDHPLDPANKYLYHSFVESPDMMNIYNGNVTTDGSGHAVVTLPAYFEALNQDFRYQLTVIGTFAQAIVSQKVQGNRFEIATSQPNVEVSWQVTGIRHDAFANANRIPTEVEKQGNERGHYLHPAAFNAPVSMGLMSTATGASAAGTSLGDAPVNQAPAVVTNKNSGGSLEPVRDVKQAPAQSNEGGSVSTKREGK